eukprot:COSAG02_NODE_1793_length_10918_cov_41.286533_5_plen_85_part_00
MAFLAVTHGRASITVNVEAVTGTDNDPSDATVTIDAAATSQSGSPIEAVRFPWQWAAALLMVISRFWGPMLEKDAKKVYAYLLE